MAGLPQSAEHASTYATEFTERLARGGEKIINGVEEEKKLVGKVEQQILAALACNPKFTLNGFDKRLKLGASVSAGPNGRVRRRVVHHMDFVADQEWLLQPAAARAMYSTKESTLHIADDEQKRKIMASCPTLSGEESGDIYMTGVHERLSTPSDLRHVFYKLYLMLSDYTLAVTSKVSEREEVEGLRYPLAPNLTQFGRLAAILDHDIVVDADEFTPEELGLLGIGCAEYPSVRYCGQNIYTSCCMKADDLLIVSDREIDVDTSLSWGSPDRLYHTMWTLAAKMNAIPSLMSALENMRGKCGLARSMLPHLEGNIINSMVPLSFSVERSMGGDLTRNIVVDMPGYFSTSLALVADLLVGEAYHAVASCTAEALGAIGPLVSSATPAQNPVINGIFREYGLQHTSSEQNMLLRNWEIMQGRPMVWEFGVHLKSYCLGIAGSIYNGLDIQVPQILLLIPSLTAINTSYGLARGWQGPAHVLQADKARRAADSDRLCAVSWLMGERPVRPKVFFNRSGAKSNSLSAGEMELSAEGEGKLDINTATFWLADTLGGRVDEDEDTASDLYSTAYAGTVCAYVYDYQQSSWRQSWVPPKNARQSLKGEVPPMGTDKAPVEGLGPVTPDDKTPTGPIASVPWGAPPKRGDNASVMESLRTMSRGNSLVASAKPKYVQSSLDGTPSVAPYRIGGVETNEWVDDTRFSKGDSCYAVIDNPGGNDSPMHALLEVLKTGGRIGASDVARGHRYFDTAELADKVTTSQDLSAVCSKWGINLQVLHDNGHLESFDKAEGKYTATVLQDSDGVFHGIRKEKSGGEQITIETETPLAPGVQATERIQSLGNLFASMT